MSTELCGVRNPDNMGIACGKARGHLRTDAVHRFVADDPATLEWVDSDPHLWPDYVLEKILLAAMEEGK